MKLRKVLSVLLAAAMIAVVASGCSGNQSTSTSTSTSNSSASKVTEISVTYLTLGTTPKDLNLVQDAVNKITVPKIGVKVKFYTIPIGDTFTKYSTLLAGKEDIDLMAIAFQNLQSYVSSGSLAPLDDYISKYAPDIQKDIKNYSITDGATFSGKAYGISPVTDLGFQGSVIMKDSLLKSANITVDANKAYSYDDLTNVCAAIKKANPKVYPLGIVGSNAAGSTTFQFFHVMDTLGATVSSGALLDTNSTKIVDVYDTKEYYDFLKAVKQWHDAGYIMPDAATTDSTGTELITSGVIGSTIMKDEPSQLTVSWGPVTAINTTELYRPSVASSAEGYWAIPNYSTKAEAAIKFLNLTYADDDLNNIIQCGIEGKHYKVVDKTNGIVDFADGITAATSGYYPVLAMWGNQLNVYSFSKVSDKEAKNDYANRAKKNPTKAVGYLYDSSKMTNQVTAINNVCSAYQTTLETGSESNLDTTYNAFIKALKAANIDTVISDNQKQFDAWLTKQ